MKETNVSLHSCKWYVNDICFLWHVAVVTPLCIYRIYYMSICFLSYISLCWGIANVFFCELCVFLGVNTSLCSLRLCFRGIGMPMFLCLDSVGLFNSSRQDNMLCLFYPESLGPGSSWGSFSCIQYMFYNTLGGGFMFLLNVHPYLGKIPVLTNMFQMGWNHQLVLYLYIVIQLVLPDLHHHSCDHHWFFKPRRPYWLQHLMSSIPLPVLGVQTSSISQESLDYGQSIYPLNIPPSEISG